MRLFHEVCQYLPSTSFVHIVKVRYIADMEYMFPREIQDDNGLVLAPVLRVWLEEAFGPEGRFNGPERDAHESRWMIGKHDLRFRTKPEALRFAARWGEGGRFEEEEPEQPIDLSEKIPTGFPLVSSGALPTSEGWRGANRYRLPER